MTYGDKSDAMAESDPIAGAIRSKLDSANVLPGLHVVATPIGNLADITLRALAVLARADVIACEDTRVTGKLKSAFGLTAPLVSYHDHNAGRAGPPLIERLESGGIVALVSDAGTPLISDPGYRLVRDAVAADVPVFSVPGPSASVAALVGAGLPTDRFFFGGFLPSRPAARRAALAGLAAIPATLIFYESPRRLRAALADMAEILGRRDAAIVRELTKRHEEIRRGALEDLARRYAAEDAPKGEIVVVIGPPDPAAAAPSGDVDSRLRAALERASVRDAAAAVAADTGWARRDVYRRALALRADRTDPDDSGADGHEI
jgi:16S rRNA (cytidine1402-2'-O)-methyltransferase